MGVPSLTRLLRSIHSERHSPNSIVQKVANTLRKPVHFSSPFLIHNLSEPRSKWNTLWNFYYPKTWNRSRDRYDEYKQYLNDVKIDYGPNCSRPKVVAVDLIYYAYRLAHHSGIASMEDSKSDDAIERFKIECEKWLKWLRSRGFEPLLVFEGTEKSFKQKTLEERRKMLESIRKKMTEKENEQQQVVESASEKLVQSEHVEEEEQEEELNENDYLVMNEIESASSASELARIEQELSTKELKTQQDVEEHILKAVHHRTRKHKKKSGEIQETKQISLQQLIEEYMPILSENVALELEAILQTHPELKDQVSVKDTWKKWKLQVEKRVLKSLKKALKKSAKKSDLSSEQLMQMAQEILPHLCEMASQAQVALVLTHAKTTLEDASLIMKETHRNLEKLKKRSFRLKSKHYRLLRQIAIELDMRFIYAKSDGESQCAALACETTGLVDAVLSDDIDAILFGAPLMLIDAYHSYTNEWDRVRLISRENVENCLKVTCRRELVRCVLKGMKNDYSSSPNQIETIEEWHKLRRKQKKAQKSKTSTQELIVEFVLAPPVKLNKEIQKELLDQKTTHRALWEYTNTTTN